MRKLLFCLTILIAWYTPADAGFLRNNVDFADLAQLSAEGLEALKETEFEVFLANLKLARAKDAEKQAEGDLSGAKHTLDTKGLDLKAAKAEYEAGKANQDEERMKKAEEAIRRARENVEMAELLVKWKQKVVKARSAAVKKAKLGVDLAEANRDLARVSRLVAEKVSSANKYSVKDYEARVKKFGRNTKQPPKRRELISKMQDNLRRSMKRWWGTSRTWNKCAGKRLTIRGTDRMKIKYAHRQIHFCGCSPV